MALHHKNSNETFGFWINRERVLNQVDIRMETKFYHLNLFKGDYPVRPSLDGLEFDRISSHEKGWVERPFSENEVHRSIMGIKGDNVPCLDGFTITF